MNATHPFPSVETLEPRLLLSSGWTVDAFAEYYGGGSEGYGPASDMVVRTANSNDYVTVAAKSTIGMLWATNDFTIVTEGYEKRILTNSDDDGAAPALVETPSGYLRGVWYNATDQSLMFAAEGHYSWSSNSPITLDTGGVGEWSDMALESDGDLHVVYYDRTEGSVKYAYHAVDDAWNSWTLETIDTVGPIAAAYGGVAVGEVAAVAVDSSGTPHVAYYSATGTQLEYAHRTGADAWTTAVLDADGDVGSHPSIAVDGDDTVHLTYYDISDRSLMYDTRTAAGWTGAQVVEAPTASGYPQGGNSLALDAQGFPHIAYTYTLSNNAENLKHAWIDGAWTNETVDTTINHGFFPSMTITQSGAAYIAYGMNYTQSIYVAEKAGVGEPGGPDLAVAITNAGGGTYIPGDTVASEITITNAGVEPAVGDVMVEVGVAIDTGGGFAYHNAYQKTITVDLAPGQSTTFTANQPIPVDAEPGEVYQAASITPDESVGDVAGGNNQFQASTADDVLWAVGEVDGRTVKTLTVEDADGDTIKLGLKGAGSLVATPGDQGVDQIVVSGTDARSTITITVNGADGQTFVGDLIIEGDVAKITAPDVFITGDVTIGGFCKTLILGTVDAGHLITINGDQTPVDPADLKKNALTLIFDDVVGTTVDTNGLAIKTLKALDWNEGSITAPWIGSIQITGTKNGAFAGDMNLGLTLSGAGAPKQTLGKVRAAGALTGNWDITGDVGVVQAGGASLWTLDADGDLKNVKLKGLAANTDVIVDGAAGLVSVAEWDNGGVTADSVKKVTITGSKSLALDGDADMDFTISGDGVAAGKFAVGQITIKGEAALDIEIVGSVGKLKAGAIDAADVDVSEGVKSINVAEGMYGDYSARWIGSIQTRGGFFATVNLSQTPDPKIMALGKLNVAGVIAQAEIKTAGHIGQIQAGAVRDSSIFAGWDSSVDANGDGILDLFDVGDAWTQEAAIKKFTIKGLPEAYSLDNTNIAASEIGKFIMTGEARVDETPGAEPFGLACEWYSLMNSKTNRQVWKNGEPVDTYGNFVVRVV